jgi:peroxiredoxin (alkyl hydroperoxide reductase subunit C)
VSASEDAKEEVAVFRLLAAFQSRFLFATMVLLRRLNHFFYLSSMAYVDSAFPEFSLEVYDPQKDAEGRIHHKDFFGKGKNTKFLVLFFYPADFTYICPTELADLHRRQADFKKYATEIVVVSTDTVFTHKAWIETEEMLHGLQFPMAADHNGKLSRELGIYDEHTGLAKRATFIIDGKNTLRAVDIVSGDIGRSAGELLRKVKALHFVATNTKGHVCPASWEEGDKTLKPSIKIAGKVSQELRGKK